MSCYAPCHEDLRVEIYLHISLNLSLDGDEWLALCPSCYSRGEGAPDRHWLGSWVYSRASLDAVAKKIHIFARNWTVVVHTIAQTLYWPKEGCLLLTIWTDGGKVEHK